MAQKHVRANACIKKHKCDKPGRSLQARRVAMVKQYWQNRKLGLHIMPSQICSPALAAGTFIANQAITCAMQALLPGSGMINRAAAVGKQVVDKLGLAKPLMDARTKFLRYFINKLLVYLGCPAQKRRMFSLGGLVNGVKSAASSVASKANAFKNSAVAATKQAASLAATSAKGAADFANKYKGVILPIVCPVVKKLCAPACTAAATGFQAAGTTINATFHVPVGCITNILEAGCNKLCTTVCPKRRLAIKKL